LLPTSSLGSVLGLGRMEKTLEVRGKTRDTEGRKEEGGHLRRDLHLQPEYYVHCEQRQLLTDKGLIRGYSCGSPE
jgi:hypothetical protein